MAALLSPAGMGYTITIPVVSVCPNMLTNVVAGLQRRRHCSINAAGKGSLAESIRRTRLSSNRARAEGSSDIRIWRQPAENDGTKSSTETPRWRTCWNSNCASRISCADAIETAAPHARGTANCRTAEENENEAV